MAKKVVHNGKDKKLYANESALSSSIIKRINESGKARVRKVHGSVMGAPTLDIEGHFMGVHIMLEVKQPGKKPTDRQQNLIETQLASGGIATWTDYIGGADLLMGFVEEWLGRCLRSGKIQITEQEMVALKGGFI